MESAVADGHGLADAEMMRIHAILHHFLPRFFAVDGSGRKRSISFFIGFPQKKCGTFCKFCVIHQVGDNPAGKALLSFYINPVKLSFILPAAQLFPCYIRQYLPYPALNLFKCVRIFRRQSLENSLFQTKSSFHVL